MYYIYYCDQCNCFHYDKKAFEMLVEAKSFCDNEVKDCEPYVSTDTPRNNHFHFEVYDGDPIVPLEDGGCEYREPIYQTGEYYKDME